MGKPALILLLLVLNATLLTGLFRLPASRSGQGSAQASQDTGLVSKAADKGGPSSSATAVLPPVTPFATVYASRPIEFAANLRRVGCPEETVKDILTAEIGRRYRRQETNLRPTPGDHLPWGWSSKTHEAKIIERRQQAAAIAREQESLLRDSLGYEVKIPMPNYAMTVSDQRFQATLESLPPEKRRAAHLANEQYWTRVEQLRTRTRGFWEEADVEELNQLKDERRSTLEALQKEAP